MESASALQHQRLNHLHQASQILFASSPSASAYLASELRTYAKDCSITLSETTWRRNCASCGYALIPGWTASVKVKSWMRESNIGRNQKQGDDKKVTSRKRKRSRRSKIKQSEQVVQEDQLSSSSGNSKLADSLLPSDNLSSSRVKHSSSKRPTRTNTNTHDPRVRYTCRVCDKTTTQLLYPLNSSTIRSTVSTPASTPAPGSPAPLEFITSQSTASTSVVKEVTASGPGALSSTSRKRAKARKNTLSELLAKEKMRQPAPSTGSSGFGLDLMDMFKTT